MKKGQISVEFLTIFGFAFLMTIPLIYVFFDTASSVDDRIAQNQIRNVALKIVDEAEHVYYLGEPSKTTLDAHFPQKIAYINISDNYVLFNYRTMSNDLAKIEAVSQVNLTGNLSAEPGTHHIIIEVKGDEVSITD